MVIDDILHAIYCCLPETPLPAVPSLSATISPHTSTGGKDRVSTLSNDLLRNVVSHLTLWDTARTTALSSRWCGIWCSTPLVLQDCHLISSADLRDSSGLAAFVSRVLTVVGI
jgi:hypothetical protein